ncbi:MAG TPA: acetyl-CoA C-acetyltransferase [Candidatus Obscuribacter sp.]|nr:acetyl-CoA C-acetyltransferase [Candidatus Obscuribacter sp.]MBK9279691.1 acetyl-CoA C-acetyltransferase [Candidatus Obscuribacter sp.]HMW89550.1 acetyl-CoA C-acetyltransferase [Candidatus Obscuribacter sp.]HMX45148.1 acetyl-CoA C-acetyltransferase [Candidatus Obscuribacter sp.]HMY53106.1 acetyl-CoA C-acetyltransferase [Candidatus Obscuribacter sp.]
MTRAGEEREVVIVDAVRTPIGRYGGALKDVRPDDLAAHVIKGLLARNPQVPTEEIEDVLMGCANQAGEDNRNVARMAVLLAGLPVTVAGGTVNRLCGSGLMAVNDAVSAIRNNLGDIFIAGGVESMTRSPFVMGKPEAGFPRGDMKLIDTTLGWRFLNKALAALHHPYAMGETAENVAEKYQISREEQDAFALSSQHKYKVASEKKLFDDEILPVLIPRKKGEPITVSQDEHPRPETTIEELAKLKPAFREGGSVTAGNASGINDGAAALLLMTAKKAAELGLKPMARFVSAAVAGVDPAIMGVGPVPATRKALQRAGLKISEIDLMELNEAFAVQVLACARDLEVDLTRMNVLGGSIALGHPLGASGARILTTLVHEMQRRDSKTGLATMCIGVGQGIATIIARD